MENKNIQLIETNKFDLNIEEFNKKIYRHYKFIVKKPLNYLNWRYMDSRAGDYYVRAALEDGNFLGYAVFRINKKEEYYQGFIVDLLANPDRQRLMQQQS